MKKIMSKRSIALLLAALPCLLFAQVKDPVKWSFSAKKTATGYDVVIVANLEKGWHTYSQNTPDGGPVATSFTFTKNPLLTLDGKVTEKGKLEKKFEELFDLNVLQYSNTVTFTQKVRLKGKVKTNLSGTVEFMVCNDKECLPPKKVPFTIALQ